MDSSVPPAATGPTPCEALPLLNRLADYCVVYGVDHRSLVKNNESRNRFSSLHKWVSPWLFCVRACVRVCACIRHQALDEMPDLKPLALSAALGVEQVHGSSSCQ